MSIHSHEQVHTPHTQRDDDSPECTEKAAIATQEDNLTLSKKKGEKNPYYLNGEIQHPLTLIPILVEMFSRKQ